MKQNVLILLLAASTAAALAQTPQPAPAAAKHTATATKSATTAAKHTATTAKLPYGVPAPGIPAVKTLKKTLFSLRYQDIKIGAGAVAEPNKLYSVQYTGWLADGGVKFDSSYDHPRPPVMGKDGKPVLGPDGKPEQGPPQPIRFPQGFGRVIPGFDQGFDGMRIGGKRRIFIPWQLAYGEKGRPGPNAEHPGIPPKADLIFDVELVGVEDMPMPPNRPGMIGGMHGMPGHPMPGIHPMPEMHPMPGMHPMAPGAKPEAPKAPAAAPMPATSTAAPAPAAAPKPAAPAQPQSK